MSTAVNPALAPVRVPERPPVAAPAPALSRLPHVAAVLAYLALGVVLMARFLGAPDGRVSGHLPVDHTWFEWLLSHGTHVVRHGGNPLFSTAQNTPYGVNMM